MEAGGGGEEARGTMVADFLLLSIDNLVRLYDI